MTTRVLVQAAHPKAKGLRARVAKLAGEYLSLLGVNDAELSIALVGDAAIRRLNRTWRRKDEATDVLSFPAGDLPAGVPGPRPLGDVVISMDTAARVAKAEGAALREEVARYLAHGVLHLLGHDHERSAAAARRMAALEAKLLGGAGLIRRTAGH